MNSSLLKEIKLTSFLVALVLFPVLLTFLFQDHATINTPISPDSLEQLSKEFREGGVQQFLDAKHQLKRKVGHNLHNDKDKASQLAAMNLAVYLFPELLEDTHLEKDFAQQHFQPLQTKIESAPGTEQARQNFEELRNVVWTYENPKQDEQGLSDYARQMLKIYGALSWK
ncbi:hypothetical protein EBT16_03890 [bacterium]|nr:hypothetical protein [bacterium]